MKNRNPDPVVVGLVFAERHKIIVVKRNIIPYKGKFALPGGYIERGEDWRTALEREIREEACVQVSTNPKHMKVYDVLSTPDGEKILIFAKISPSGVRLLPFKKNKEVSERFVYTIDLYSRPELCFPLHNQVVEKYQNSNISWNEQHPGGW